MVKLVYVDTSLKTKTSSLPENSYFRKWARRRKSVVGFIDDVFSNLIETVDAAAQKLAAERKIHKKVSQTFYRNLKQKMVKF